MQSDMMIFTTDDEQVELNVKLENETVWLTQAQMSELFGKARSTISEHIKNVFVEGELDEEVVCRNFRHTTQHGAIKGKEQVSSSKYYNLDVIISVGYRVKSQKGTQFRIWATQRLKDYLIKGYAINQKRLAENQQQFLQTLEDLKSLTHTNQKIETNEILSLIQSFSDTWFTLDSYDKNEFPKQGDTQAIETSADELQTDLQTLKSELIGKGEATELFAQEKKQDALAGILGNVFQSVFGQDAYPTVEEKSAHLLYFIIKNHPFTDGNKRSGAFAFIWLLQKYGYDFKDKINPQTLTTLTILIAESDPVDKDKMIGVVKLLLNPMGFE